MTDKYCPLRFREYDSNPHDQRCIGESCAWFDKCSQSHGEPRTDTVETQTRVRTETDAETAQEPREADENACSQDSREKLEADVLDAGCADEIDYDRIIGWLDRQAAMTERECREEYESLCDGKRGGWSTKCFELAAKCDELQAQVNELTAELERETLSACNSCAERIELQERVDELERENARLSSDELHWRTQAQQADSVREARISKLLEQRDEARAEADYYRSLYERMAKAVDDVARNYTVVDEDGEVIA